MTHFCPHSTLVCKGRSEAHRSCLSEDSRFLGNHKQEGSRGMGGEMADGRWGAASFPSSSKVTAVHCVPRETVPSAEHEQVWLGFKNKGYLSRAGKHGSRQRSGKACIFHWGGIGI